MSFLKICGTKFVDDQGREVILKGAALGGWMSMENFISGFPGCEHQIREALAETIGQEKSDLFFDKFLEYFFTDADAQFFESLGFNSIRIPFNYRHFEDDMNPRVLKESGFKHLDRVIDICSSRGIYTILDLHAAPGGQNICWHSDHGGYTPNFWNHKDFQDRTLWLWTELAKHYKDNRWIAGYNPLNEPTDSKQTRVITFYDRVYRAIRAIDTDHIIFFDGNTYATDFSHFGDAHERWQNTAYSIHDYTTFGSSVSPGQYVSSDEQRRTLKRDYEEKRAWMDERGLCVWNGEWGVAYARKQYDGEATDSINLPRYKVLRDQLEIYREAQLSWNIWLYKDIGVQGMTYVSPETPYMALFSTFLAKKHRLAADVWGADDTAVRHIYKPLLDHLNKEIPEEFRTNIYPHWNPVKECVRILSSDILLSLFLIKEWAQHFVGMNEAELDAIAGSFKFEGCLKRQELNAILAEDARAVHRKQAF